MGTRKFYLDRAVVESEFEDCRIDDLSEIIAELEKEISGIIKRKHKALIPSNNEIYDEAKKFVDVYPGYDLTALPLWVKEDINHAKIIGKSGQTILMKDGRKYQLNNSLNHLSGGEWTYFTNSVLNTAYKTSGTDSHAHKIRKIHPTPKPPQLMEDIIKFFTKENELVFDYFMGVGGSLLGAGLSGRKAAGIELNEKYISAYKLAAKEMKVPIFQTYMGDCLEVLSNKECMIELTDKQEISLVLLDPPYGNMMSREKTGADIKVYGNVATPFTDSEKDFGNLDLDVFFEKLKESVELILPYVKVRGHIVIFIKDLQPSGKDTNLLHAKIIDKLNEIPKLNYKGLKIWADQTAKLFPYGYPFSFVANQIHQYILIFRKEKP